MDPSPRGFAVLVGLGPGLHPCPHPAALSLGTGTEPLSCPRTHPGTNKAEEEEEGEAATL